VGDGRLDLATVADDARVAEEPLDVTPAEVGHALDGEPGERRAEGLALAQDGEPGEPRLEPLQAQLLVEARVVVHGHPPLLVVVAEVERVGPGPGAAN